MSGSGRLASLVLFGPAAGWLTLAATGLVVALASDPAPVDRATAKVTGSATCLRCHPEQHASWHASYHRTMTQDATAAETLLAPFAGESLHTLGFVATMTGGAQQRPHVRVEGPGGEVVLDVDVALTVGSHRYQQYVAQIDRGGGPHERWRLPVAWHREARRWIHLGGAFLTPDGRPGDRGDYLRHLSRYEDNCLFCHNTEPSPGLGDDGTFTPRIGELGIACEACHGRASEHVARHEDPARRLLTARDARPPDDSIARPDRLDPGRSADVCGRCHGQRIAHDIAAVLRRGDGFVPGNALAEVSRPILREASLDGHTPFAARFWPDGTPRLSAYEYQALVLSPCFDQGRGLTCGDCHTMHGDEPAMQLRADFDLDAACGRCHAPAAAPDGGPHGGHEASVDCGGCHLPRVTYGLITGMMSHRITTPDPGAAVGHADRPDACTQCHVDRSRTWAADALARLGLQGSEAGPPGETEAWASRVVLDLVGGDPIQRAVAAHALSRPGATGAVRDRIADLSLALEDDYPAVRWIAARGIEALAAAEPTSALTAAFPAGFDAAFDFMGDASERLAVVDALRTLVGTPALARRPTRLEALQARRDDQAIWIGE